MDSVIEAGSAAVAPATAKAPATVAKDTQFNCSFSRERLSAGFFQ